MTIRILTIYILLSLLPVLSQAASPPRPFTGQGVLIVRPLDPDSATPPSFTLYREPGVGRIAEHPMADMPRLSSHLNLSAGEYPLAVMGKKGEWLLVAFDDAGREGWVKMSRWWEYLKWEDFLKGRYARLLPGLKRESYLLHEEPSDKSHPSGGLSGEERLIIIDIRGDWVLAVASSLGLTGWLPWRDGDGRFLVTIGEKISPQNR